MTRRVYEPGRRLHVRDYASGEKVLMDRGSELRQRLLELSPDVYGFEMKGHGLLHSVWEAAGEERPVRGDQERQRFR